MYYICVQFGDNCGTEQSFDHVIFTPVVSGLLTVTLQKLSATFLLSFFLPPVKKAQKAMASFRDCGFEELNHPPYSPGLTQAIISCSEI